jgi:DDE_Tnp_1-associated
VVLGLEQDVVLDQVECDRLVAFLDAVPDRRKRRGRQYRLSFLLAVAVVAMTAADLSVASIGEWVATAPASLLIALGARVNRQGQPDRPDATTIGRALAAAGQELDRALCAWVGALRRAWRQTPMGPGCGTAACTRTAKRSSAPSLSRESGIASRVRADDCPKNGTLNVPSSMRL